MDQGTEKRLDAIMEDELQLGYRIKRVPDNVHAEWVRECGSAPVRVRFTRINPARRRKIAAVVQAQYHKDLANKDILSHDQIMKLVTERGEWSDALQQEMDELRNKTTQEMGLLFMSGDADNNWGVELLKKGALFREAVVALTTDDFERRTAILARFDRWVEYSPEMQADYTERFAAEQGREKYSPDFDLQRLYEATAADIGAAPLLDEIDGLRDKLDRFIALQRSRIKLRDLQIKYAKMFADTVEQRRDNTDELARMYYTTEAVDDRNVPLGPIAKTYEAMLDAPQNAIEWLLTEAYFMQNNIPDEARDYLETFGFLPAEQANEKTDSPPGESEQSDESPAPQISKLDSEPAAETVSAASD